MFITKKLFFNGIKNLTFFKLIDEKTKDKRQMKREIADLVGFFFHIYHCLYLENGSEFGKFQH